MISVLDKDHLMVGYKQTLKALNKNIVNTVYLSQSCDDKLRLTIEEAASKTDASIMYINSMRELGAMCGIEVGASCAVLLK